MNVRQFLAWVLLAAGVFLCSQGITTSFLPFFSGYEEFSSSAFKHLREAGLASVVDNKAFQCALGLVFLVPGIFLISLAVLLFKLERRLKTALLERRRTLEDWGDEVISRWVDRLEESVASAHLLDSVIQQARVEILPRLPPSHGSWMESCLERLSPLCSPETHGLYTPARTWTSSSWQFPEIWLRVSGVLFGLSALFIGAWGIATMLALVWLGTFPFTTLELTPVDILIGVGSFLGIALSLGTISIGSFLTLRRSGRDRLQRLEKRAERWNAWAAIFASRSERLNGSAGATVWQALANATSEVLSDPGRERLSVGRTRPEARHERT